MSEWMNVVNLSAWLSCLSAGVRYRVVRWKYRRFGRSLFLSHVALLQFFRFMKLVSSWHRGKVELEMGNVDIYWLVQSLRFDVSSGGDVCRIVSISAFRTVAVFYPVFRSSPTVGQKTAAPSISLWHVFHLFVADSKRSACFKCVACTWGGV